MKDRVFKKKSLYSKPLRNKDFTYLCVLLIDTGLPGKPDLDVRHSYRMNFLKNVSSYLCVSVNTLRSGCEVRGHIFWVGLRDWWTQADRLGSRHFFHWGVLAVLCLFKPLPGIMKKPNQLVKRQKLKVVYK